MRSRTGSFVAAVVLAFGATVPAMAQGVAQVGAKQSYTWQQPLVNGRGVKSLADLQGRPVVVEFWGTR
ncbi:MAG: hypothetical protein JNL90_19155 [Planctomycetes bacterium]|nr:hypothetical protein [Planctomycetota bacterium]